MSKFKTFEAELAALCAAHGVELAPTPEEEIGVHDAPLGWAHGLCDCLTAPQIAIHHATLIKRVTLDAGAKAVTLKFDSVAEADAYYRETVRRRAL